MAKGNRVVDTVGKLAQPICDELGLILWDVRFEKEGPEWYLRVIIDRSDEGVYINDCEDVSRKLDPILDDVDPISQNYILEVSSAGLGRKLTKQFHFESKIGETVRIKYKQPKDGIKEEKGQLLDIKGEIIKISTENGEKLIDLKDTSYVKLCDDEDLF